jgi:hypothetical protein
MMSSADLVTLITVNTGLTDATILDAAAVDDNGAVEEQPLSTALTIASAATPSLKRMIDPNLKL